MNPDLELVGRLLQENKQLNAQVTALQERCTALEMERRRTHIDYAVREFHEKFGHPAPRGVAVPPEDRVRFRARLIVEEFMELMGAMFKSPNMRPWVYEELVEKLGWFIRHARVDVDMVKWADGTHDLDYVVAGTRVEFGYEGRDGAAEVHRANMEKGVDDGTGKPTKPPGWRPPDIEAVLSAQGWRKS